ncbi:MAG: hypothetical protein RL255_548, partial [Actinomycetota bacterium]
AKDLLQPAIEISKGDKAKAEELI